LIISMARALAFKPFPLATTMFRPAAPRAAATGERAAAPRIQFRLLII
jgi:hypothetical protein